MHKKLFTAVLALGLLLLAQSTAFALSAPAIPGEAPVLAFGGNQSKAGLTPTAEVNPDPLVTVNGGQNRTVPGTFCDGNWYAPFGFTVGGWYVGNEFYAAYQDPSNATYWNGTCINTPSFDVTAVNMIVRFSAGPFPKVFAFQPLVFDNGPAGCTFDGIGPQPAPVAGGALCAGPLYAFQWNAAASFLINMGFPTECCITGDYYASWYSPTSGGLRLGCTNGTMDNNPNGPGSGTECLTFNDYGSGWDELTGNYFGAFDLSGAGGGTVNSLEHILYSEGYTPDDPATHCNPGACAYEYWYDPLADPDFAFGLPSGSGGGRTRQGVWVEAVGLDTLSEVVFAMNGPTPAVPADITIEIYAATLPGVACNGGPMPGFADVPVYSEVVPGASVVWGGYTVLTLATPYVWGTLNGGPSQRIVVALGDDSPGTTNGLLANNDDGACTGTDHYVARYNGPAAWLNIFDVSGIAPHPFMELGICREVLPAVEDPCVAAADSEWPQYGGNSRQSFSSTINVGDPQEVTLSWTTALPRINSFNSPVVANDIVYVSTDLELNAYSLSTGAPVGTFTGAPEMGSVNRGNATVAPIATLGRDVVFATGGNLQAITALETDLETSPIIWSNNVTNFNAPNGLFGQQRFNTSKVVNVAGTDVLLVVTEPTGANPGRLFAFNAATGALFPGWATNPLMLDAAAKHGPTILGSKAYVGTANSGSNSVGSLYQINLADGVVDWNYIPVAGEGWPSGVSAEGTFLYGASWDGTDGRRYKIDVSGALPSIVWTSTQGQGLYGTPALGSSFAYFPLDNPSFGMLQVDKGIGTVARNFAAVDLCGVSLGSVPHAATISCDAYLFVGDRSSHWWLFSAETGDIQWLRQFPVLTGGEIVNGTALASHSGGTDYALVSVRQLNGTVGQLSAYELNAGPRPRLVQCVSEETVVVPLGAGPGNPHSVADVFTNIGGAPLNFTALNITDPLPDGMSAAAKNARDFRTRTASAGRDFDGYNTLANTSSLTKQHRLAGLTTNMVDGEFMTTEVAQMAANEALIASPRSSASRSMAASASMIRTSAVLVGGAAVPTAIGIGSTAGLDWIYDGTGLGRGSDANDLEFDMDDPDFNYDGSPVATFHILYQGGCLFAVDTLHFNSDGSYQAVFNHGNLGEDAGTSTEFNFAADAVGPNADFFDGSLIVAGDSVVGGVAPDFGAQIYMDMFGNQERFVPNVAPTSGVCGFDVLRNITLGAKRTGGCPGAPVDIHGDIIVSAYSDTNFAATAGSPGAALGLDYVQTTVGAYDPLYGDFTLVQWKMTNRDAVAKGPIHAGTMTDWDVNAGTDNNGIVSDAFGGYALWSRPVGTIAYGMLDPNRRSTYSSTDGSANSPHKIWVLSNPTEVYDPAPWDMADDSKLQTVWSQLVNGGAREVHGPGTNEDKSGLLVNKAFNIGPNGTAAIHQAIFGVNAASDNPVTIEANAAALAKRAARWGGFARGDVNDDGLVDLADVCWLQGGNTIYPAAYSGDVDADGDNDAADVTRLLSYVSGNAGDQPAGAWRF